MSDMYNQVSRGPHFGPGGSQPPAAPPQHAYQQQAHPPPPPPPPPHFQQGAVPPGPHVYLRGPPAASSMGAVSLPFQAPHSVVQGSGQYGNTMPPQNFASHGQNLQNYSNLGGQSLHAHLPVPPPPHGHSHQEMSWLPGPPPRVLPPPPPPPPASSQGQVLYKPPFLPPPPSQPGGSQNVRNTPPPLPPPGSGLLALTPDGVYQHSNDGNYQVPSFAPSLPPLPSSPPPVPPSPPPPTPPMASAFSNAVHSDPNSGKVSGPELKAVDSVDKFIGSYPSGIAPLHNSGPNQDSGTCRDVAAADRDKQLSTESAELRPQAVDSTEPQYHLHVATENADSDMEMEDDITLSDKDQAQNNEIDAHNQWHHRVGEEFSINENVHQLKNLKENDPAKDILSSGASCFGFSGVSKKHEGPEHLSDLGDMKSAQSVAKVNSPVNDSSEVAEFPLGTVLEKSAAHQNGTSDLIEATNPDRDCGQLLRSGSPIRLLQDYASDDTSNNEETCGTDANILTVSVGVATGVSVAHKDSGSYLETDIGSKSPSSTQKGFVQLSKTALNDSEISQHLEQESRRCVEDNHENQVSVAASIEAFQGKAALGGTVIESGSKSGNVEQEYVRKGSKFEASVLKVDEFGRHLREAPTDSNSESDDSHYRQTRRVNKRGRSRSRSPLDRSRNRRRKSPRRRKGKRSQSRSWSPRHRRSRSRSPILKRTVDFGGEIVKRDRGQCFNFFRGKCYRGASCRYSHHEPDKNASLRHSRNKHDQEVYSRAKYSRINKSTKNISPEVSDHECDGIRNQDVDPFQNVTGQVEKRKEDSFGCAVASTTSNIDSQSVSNNPIKSDSFREATPEMQETLVLREEPNKLIHENDILQKAVNSHQPQVGDDFCPEALGGGDTLKPSSGTYVDIIHAEDGSFVHQIQPNVSVEVSEHSGYASQLKNASIVSNSSSDKIPMISPGANKASSCEPSTFMLPSTQPLSATSSVGPWLSSEQPLFLSQASKELTLHCSSSAELPLPAYQLAPPVVSHAHNENVVHFPQSSRDYGETQQSTSFPFQSTNREKIEPYPGLLHMQNPHFSVPPNYSWTSLPPPPPLPSQAVYNSSLNSGVTKSHVTSEFNQSQLHLRDDFVSQTSGKSGLPSYSQTPEFQAQAYPPMQDHSRTSVPTEAFSPKHLPQENPASQLLSGPNFIREELYKQFPMQDSKFSSSVGLHPQQKQYSWQSDVNRLQPSFGGKLTPEDHFKMSPHIHPSSQKQQSIFNFQYSASEGNLGVPGETVTVSRYPPDVLDSNHSTSLPAFGGSRISAHYNPYASTFEQPLSSKFTSSIFRQESEIIHGNSYGSYRLNPTVNREGIDVVGSRQLLSSPKSARAVGQSLPRSDDKQYDPLFDSIEPASSSLKKYDFEQKQEVTGESNVSLRPKSSYLSLDVEEQNKQEEVGAVASTTSQNNDEYGETEEAEVGDVDNESLSNHVDVANISTGDIEINQIKSPGKRKKSKDSRSMKLFKVSIANFVKDVLKPSWRQGNMSKVAFKTIVKKTVDKVSGAMKGHRIPKSQAKISQYIDSSQRKLTKLVMGYVDKYVKV